jgi:hypothetical protein
LRNWLEVQIGSTTPGIFCSRFLDLNESLSGSDSSDSEDDENGNARKDTTLSVLLKKQAALSSKNEVPDALVPKKQKQGPGKAPLYWFNTPILPKNTSLCFYRAIFTNAEQEDGATMLDIIRKKQLSPQHQPKIAANSQGVPSPEAYKEPHIFLCMIGGGHFAAMVVSLVPKQTKASSSFLLAREATVLAHKTFHRYTTRRKQGGAQSANDSAKGAAHSAGSSLRRYNEQALTDEVRLLLQEWKGMIDTSELLFVRATGNTNRRTLFGPYDEQVLQQNDPRIRGFPFNTRRATQNELMRAFVELTRVKVLDIDEEAIAASKKAAEEASKQAAASKANKKLNSTSITARTEEEETALLHTTQIQALIRRSKIPALLSYFKTNSLSPGYRFSENTEDNHHAPTSLHLAASSNAAAVVYELLVKGGANPTVTNRDGKTPFELAGDKGTRTSFRVARSELGESKWDWETAKVPSPISRTDAAERDKAEKLEEENKENTRRKAEEARLREEGPKVADGPLGKAQGRGRALVLGQVQKSAQEKRETELRGMTPEMRMRLERERRARAAEERMKRLNG